jgi:hypothetical protein
MHDLEFDSTLDEDDYGLIISKDGMLKGVWIPEMHEEEEIPEVIVELCKNYFGLDPNNDERTIH